MKCFAMRTIQISIGELIEAVYEELVEQYGDRELALVAAQAVGDDLLQRIAPSPHLVDSGT
jgi:predicted metalloprotease